MAHLLLSNENIKGIDLHGMKNILAQFADDTSLYLKYERICLDAFTETISCVEEQLGLKVLYDKTTIYRVGSLCDSNATLYTQKNFKWSNQLIETLGTSIECKGNTECGINFQEIRRKVENVCSAWYNRTLMLFGKCLVVNMLIGIFVYKLTTML